MRTLSQEYAAKIFKQVSNIEEKEREKYSSLAHRLPILIRTAGLSQALAYVEARGGDEGKKLLQHIAEVIGVNERENLLKHSREAELEEYMMLTQNVLSALVWYKRFAQSVLDV